MKQATLLFFLILCSSPVHSQTIKEKIDFYVNESLSSLYIPTLEIALVNGDSVLFSKRYSSIEDTGEQFYIGSLSKSLTAFTVLTLVQDSLLTLDHTVSGLIPGLHFSAFEKEITVRHLLNHTSGISKKDGFLSLPGLEELNTNNFHINIMFKPGTQHEYSNLNYSLLGLIIERITGFVFSEYLQASVLPKMNMNNTGTNENLAVNQYQYWGPFPMKSSQLDFKETAIPSGFILSSANDMANYLITNMNLGKYQDNQILDSLLVQEMHRSWNGGVFGYGMGWKRGLYNDVPFLQHLGSTATSSAAMFIVPKKELGLIMITNSNSLFFSEEMAEGLLGILIGAEPKPTSKKEFYLRSSLVFLLLLICSHFIYQLFSLKKTVSSVTLRKICWDLVILIIVVGLFTFFFPILTNVPFGAFLKLQPDIGTLLILFFVFPLIIKLLSFFMSTFRNSFPKKI